MSTLYWHDILLIPSTDYTSWQFVTYAVRLWFYDTQTHLSRVCYTFVTSKILMNPTTISYLMFASLWCWPLKLREWNGGRLRSVCSPVTTRVATESSLGQKSQLFLTFHTSLEILVNIHKHGKWGAVHRYKSGGRCILQDMQYVASEEL